MKKYVLVALIGLLLSAPLFAITDTTSTQIRAVVSADLYVSSDLALGPQDVIVDGEGGTKQLGTFKVVSNVAGLWRITVSSINKGRMKADGIATMYPYTFAVRSSSGGPLVTEVSSGDTLSGNLGDGTTAANKEVDVSTGVAEVTYYLEVTTASASSLGIPAGVYEDTITITISTI